MNSVLEQIASPTWWVSVVLAGLAVSLVAAYLKPGLDGIGARLVDAWGRRSERRRQIRIARLNAIVADVSEEAYWLAQALHSTIYGGMFGIVAVILLVFRHVRLSLYATLGKVSSDSYQTGDSILFGISALLAVVSLLHMLDGGVLLRLVRDAREMRRRSASSS